MTNKNEALQRMLMTFPVSLDRDEDSLEKFRKRADAAEKRADEAEARGWQPIETAPDDGTKVLLWIPDSQMFGEGYAIDGYRSARAWRTEFHVTAEPSHWKAATVPASTPAVQRK